MTRSRRPKLSTQARLLPGDTTSMHQAAAGLQRELARLRAAHRCASASAQPPEGSSTPDQGWSELEHAAALLAQGLTDFGDELALARREYDAAERDVDRNSALARAARARGKLQKRCAEVVAVAGDAVPPAPVGPFPAYFPRSL